MHMAARVDFLRDHLAINDAVLHYSHIVGVRKLVSCLSTCVFPDRTPYPVAESMLHEGRPHRSNEGYAMAKRLINTMNRCYADQYGCRFTSVIPHERPLRQFTFSRDLTQLLLWVLDEYDSVEPIILSVGEDGKVSIKDVALEITRPMDF
ncbi:hypothetical protein PybrP1_003794 [[Pythium] brassicae (nom. inval.)]|nr:hypothetical protein PybrP1_003794 [[Pythium] brassicae (nom. inval.)]